MMNIVYCGSSEFSKEVLEGILNKNITPVLVITTPDKPQGRGYKLSPTPVKSYSQKCSLPCISPESLDDPNFIKELKNTVPDIILVVSFGKILPRSMLTVSKIMPLGVHPSLLPRYRGAAPIQRVFLNGEKETGISIFKIIEKVDAGPLLLQEKVPIENHDDIFTLSRKLVEVGVECFVNALALIEANRYRLRLQNDEQSTYASKLTKAEGRIRWEKTAEEIMNVIRATKVWPSAYTFYNQQRIQIIEAEVVDEDISAVPSTIVKIDPYAFYVATARGLFKVTKVKPEGKKEMTAQGFMCGHKLKIGDSFR